MAIFLSWSGQLSHRAATVLKDWLGTVLPTISVFLSSEGIRSGERWHDKLSRALQDCSFGILLVTRDNQSSPWLVYEAGALSKVIDTGRVVPFLLNLRPAELRSPLSHFQAVEPNREQVSRLLVDCNS